MNAAASINRASGRLLDRLPLVRGRYSENVALAAMTWFRVGGAAEVMFRPADRDDLVHFLRERPRDVRLTVLGVGSNSLVRDGGIAGVVIRLGRGFADVVVNGPEVEAGAGALDVNVALAARDKGVAGLEFLRGVPGTIGGALRMNAGAYGRETADVTVAAEAVDSSGEVHRVGPKELGFTYRHSAVPEDWIFTRAFLKGEAGDPKAIARRMAEITDARESTQPVRSRTGGSTFCNPPGKKAWQLIDAAGCRGLRRGGAQVSEQHCNFLINTGDASAADLEELGEEVRRRVKAASGVDLAWEIRLLGVAAPAEGGA
jgi:UDP-N-acetylmuramate dehydrogenase